MKKIFMILLCATLLLAVPTVAFAESETPETEESLTITEMVVNYVTEHAEELLTMGAAIASAIFVKLIGGKLSNSVSTLNNNSITIANEAGNKLADAAKELKEYKEKMAEFLEVFKKTEEEKLQLEDVIGHVETFLKSAKLATLELSNEIAELLVLANIPNAKKEEFYARHMKMVEEIKKVEGVINNDRA